MENSPSPLSVTGLPWSQHHLRPGMCQAMGLRACEVLALHPFRGCQAVLCYLRCFRCLCWVRLQWVRKGWVGGGRFEGLWFCFLANNGGFKNTAATVLSVSPPGFSHSCYWVLRQECCFCPLGPLGCWVWVLAWHLYCSCVSWAWVGSRKVEGGMFASLQLAFSLVMMAASPWLPHLFAMSLPLSLGSVAICPCTEAWMLLLPFWPLGLFCEGCSPTPFLLIASAEYVFCVWLRLCPLSLSFLHPASPACS